MKKWLVTLGYTVAGITVAAGLSLGSFALAGHQIGHYGNVQPVALGETYAPDTGTSPASVPSDLGTLPQQQPSTSHPDKGAGAGSGASSDTVGAGAGTGSTSGSGSGFSGKSTGATGSPTSHDSDDSNGSDDPDPSGTPSPHTCPSPSPSSSGHNWNGCGDD